MADAGIQVIGRAVAVLRVLRDMPDGMSLGAIARATGLPRSTVQRIVGALRREGMVSATDGQGGALRLGPEAATFALPGRDVVGVVRPHLEALAARTGETVDLAVLRGDAMVFLDQVAGTHRLRAVSAVGEVFPLHSTANGRVALALMTHDERERRSLDPDTVAAVERARRQGFAEDRENHTVGISAVGVGFRDTAGTVHAISVPVPEPRYTRDREALIAAVMQMRDRLPFPRGEGPV